MHKTIIFLLFFFICAKAFACQITVGLEDFSPQSKKVSDSSWQGRDIEIIRQFLTLANCQFDFVELPWARGLNLLKSGDIDMMINVTKTDTRSEDYHFIGPVSYEVIVLATKNDAKLKLNSAHDLLALKQPVAVQRGAYYGELLTKLIASPKNKKQFIEVTDNETKMALMNSGRISGFLEAKRNLTQGPKLKPRYQDIWYQPVVLHQTEVHYAFSKVSVSPEMINRLEIAYQRLFFPFDKHANE